MSRRNLTNSENSEFIKRFIEVCGSSQPVEISRFLNISYQAAINYLNGRIPDAKVLLIISERTPYSIHWLLTGEGKKIVENKQFKDTRILTDEMRSLVREICVEVVGELAGVQKEPSRAKTVILTSDKIKSEKVMNEIKTSSEKEF
jgi:hypothetical protein